MGVIKSMFWLGAIWILLVGLDLSNCHEEPQQPPTLSKEFSVISLDDAYDGNEVVNKSAAEILALRGFNSKVHFVHTNDGYHIHVVRIINPLAKVKQLKRPVLFNHGLMESSTIWLINSRHVRAKQVTEDDLCSSVNLNQTILDGPDLLSAPMMLSNHGYDVWLMSLRGTDWSLKHDHLNFTQPQFWNYSLDEFGLIDVPTVIDYISEETGSPKVGYVGHSQATFSVFALLSTYPEYADRIEPVVAVAPVAYMHGTTSVARIFFLRSLEGKAKDHDGPFPRLSVVIRRNFVEFCTRKGVKPSVKFVCQLLDTLIGGKGKGWRPGYHNHVPFYSSLKNMRHFGQLVKNKKFAHYDYGERNVEVYGQASPPEYPIEKIRSKALVLFYTKTDNLSHPKDVARFKERLTVPLFRDIFIDKSFNHFDMITHEDCRRYVNAPMLRVFEQFENQNGVCSSEPDSSYQNNQVEN